MSALPKAISQGSNGAGAGALTALTAISAAIAEPESSASAVANKTIFFMTIPIVVRSVRLRRPKHSDNRLQPISVDQSAVRHPLREAKKTSNCRLFRRFYLSETCCRRVLHSDNYFWMEFLVGAGFGGVHKGISATIRAESGNRSPTDLIGRCDSAPRLPARRERPQANAAAFDKSGNPGQPSSYYLRRSWPRRSPEPLA